MIIRRFPYTGKKQITALSSQSTGYIWVAFAKNSSGNCILEKQFHYDPSQNFYSIEREVDEITKIANDALQTYVAYDDEDLIGEIFLSDNPLTTSTEIAKPISVIEAPIDLQIFDDELFFLFPGSTSGENSKILTYDTDGDAIDTIDLSTSGLTITNASSMAIDDNGDIWVVTSGNPSTVVRVFRVSGGWDFAETEII